MNAKIHSFSTCPYLSSVRPTASRALRFLQYLSAKTHRRAFGTAELACKWPLGALWLAAALLGPAERAFQARRARFWSLQRAIRRDISVPQSSISLRFVGFD